LKHVSARMSFSAVVNNFNVKPLVRLFEFLYPRKGLVISSASRMMTDLAVFDLNGTVLINVG